MPIHQSFRENFQLSVERNLELLCCFSNLLCDLSRKFAPSSQPISCKTKNDRDLVMCVFPPFQQFASFHFELSLANYRVNLSSDWSLGRLCFGCFDTSIENRSIKHGLIIYRWIIFSIRPAGLSLAFSYQSFHLCLNSLSYQHILDFQHQVDKRTKNCEAFSNNAKLRMRMRG